MKSLSRSVVTFSLFVLLIVSAACTAPVLQPNQSGSTSSDVTKIEALVKEAVETRVAEVTGSTAAKETAPTPKTVANSTNTQPAGESSLASAEALQTELEMIYQQANPSVVYIITSTGSGSGFVYDDQGHIVTNSHVVRGSNDFEIVFANGARLSAKPVGVDADSDLAVLKVDALPDGVQPLALAAGDSVQVGQLVIAIGNPFGEQGSMSMGVVSGLGRSLRSQRETNALTTYSLPSVIQTDAPINPGNSGGPLLNLNGEVVGINSAIASSSGVNSGVGFAIPVQAVHQIVPSLIEKGSYTYSYMGASFASELSLSAQEQYGLPQTAGAYVVDVTAGSPAAKAGLHAANPNTGRDGDLVIAIDGVAIQDFGDMNSYLVFHTKPGQTIKLTVLRNNVKTELPVTLGERP